MRERTKKKKKPNLPVKKMLPRRERELDVVVHWFGSKSKEGKRVAGLREIRKRRRRERDIDKEERECRRRREKKQIFLE